MADTAMRLSRRFGTTAQFWLNFQAAHDLSRAEAMNDYSKARKSASVRFKPSSVNTTDFALFTGSRIMPFWCSRLRAFQSKHFQARHSSYRVRYTSASTASSTPRRAATATPRSASGGTKQQVLAI